MGLGTLIKDTIRSIKTGRAMQAGQMPDESPNGPDLWSLPDNYNLPKDQWWVIGNKYYSNAGEAKTAIAAERERLGNNF